VETGVTTRRRVARKRHWCGCGRRILPGDVYLLHTTFPGHDSGYADTAGHPVQSPECAGCATRCGRAADLARSS
jgi:hypothetical protein